MEPKETAAVTIALVIGLLMVIGLFAVLRFNGVI